ncbi:16S rRNA (cytosine(1402)-N(4))-methyltransferase RsmH [Bacteroidales bacterium OttesenSCG-928-B11]|nr:16S rRNA (cytosine(1402)-N(4))-methyltransferase RsmH [Bacteroidales bacterium OttesenSCG-928-C03]MDL2311616.1 16S rRNA (cytosine(1402)-N(4))-methyltransferase RsmH [Bacteroidales bacterium OttesenSCG-928-B11]
MYSYHQPVLLHESVSALITDPDGIYVDVTFGGGGHSQAILQRISDKGRLIAFDQDPDSEKNIPDDPRFTFVPCNFSFLNKFLRYHNAFPVDGILADFGVSSYQFDTPERGFSYRFDGKLDMRMNPGKGITAGDVINDYPEQKLMKVFFQYGELSNARKIANKIAADRLMQKITTTTELVECLKPLIPAHKENKILSQLFQALRIEVNAEMEVIEKFLLQTTDALKQGGKLVTIAYHSLEDRLVKNFMRSGNLEGKIEKDFYGNPLIPFTSVISKAQIPDAEEIERNPRARSAKMRTATKK